MTTSDIIHQRLVNQQIARTKFKTVQDIVGWMGAMQAQEFTMVKWAIGLRLPGSTEADIELAFNNGEILRTHLLRPTWHFVTPADIRWMLALTAPRVHAANAYIYHQCELPAALLNKCANIVAKTLEGGKHLTRHALKAALEKKKIITDGLRLSCIMMYAELEGIICSGARQGKQFTYALIDEWAPEKIYQRGATSFHKKDALGELTTRYFTSRGPASAQDFAYWSGLTVKEAKEGIEMLSASFGRETWKNQEYIFLPEKTRANNTHSTFLLPVYDEYGLSYKDRGAMTGKEMPAAIDARKVVFHRIVIVDGRAGGVWQRTDDKGVVAQATPFLSLPKSKHTAIDKAVKRYNTFFSGAKPSNRKSRKK
ncbi:MAG: winged helix DNA-binding domain-containing protein [Bacteroidota bacterium]